MQFFKMIVGSYNFFIIRVMPSIINVVYNNIWRRHTRIYKTGNVRIIYIITTKKSSIVAGADISYPRFVFASKCPHCFVIHNITLSIWRRGRDSNPRYQLRYGSLAGSWFQPLTHLSVIFLSILVIIVFVKKSLK